MNPPEARPPTCPSGRLGALPVQLTQALHHDQYQLVVTAAFADSGEWLADGATSAGAWLAAMADVEACTAREWIRIGRQLNELPVIAAHFAAGRLSYAKVRSLTRVATTGNETDLAALARSVPTSDLACCTATTTHRSTTPGAPSSMNSNYGAPPATDNATTQRPDTEAPSVALGLRTAR